MSSNLETVREIYNAFAEGDIDTVVSAFADDVTWVEAEGGPYGGSYNGPKQVVENVFGPINEEWDEFRVEPDRFIAEGDTVVATGTYSGTYAETGEQFEAPFAHIWDLTDGQVVHFHQHIDTVLHNEPLTTMA
jgi:ketosteroid isomerase-like protein